MRALIAEVTTLAHARTSQPVTVGLASVRWLSLVQGLGLDFYQVHWYDAIDGERLPDTFNAAHLDRPLMLGEFPTQGTKQSPEALLQMAAQGGCFAALPWSALAADNYSGGPRVVADTIQRGGRP